MKNFESTFLYQLYHRCDGISGNLVSMSSEVMRDFDSRYSGKIRVLVTNGLVSKEESYLAGVFCKKYCLTDLGCQVASEIDYKSIKDSIDKWYRLSGEWVEKVPIKNQKPRQLNDKEEKSILIMSERNCLNNLFSDNEFYDLLREEKKITEKDSKLYKEINPILFNEQKYKHSNIKITIDKNRRIYHPLNLMNKKLRALLPKFYEVDFKSSNYQMLILEFINNKPLYSHLKGEAREALRQELKDLQNLCKEDFYEEMCKDIKDQFGANWNQNTKDKYSNREYVKHSGLVFLSNKNKYCFNNGKHGFTKVQRFSTVFQKRFPKIHGIIINTKACNHNRLVCLLMARESPVKDKIINYIYNQTGIVPSIASIHDCLVTTSETEKNLITKVLDEMGICYKVTSNKASTTTSTTTIPNTSIPTTTPKGTTSLPLEGWRGHALQTPLTL